MKKIIIFSLCLILLLLPMSMIYAQASFNTLMKENIYSDIYLLASLDDGTVVLNKNSDKKVQCPSLNKIMTVAVALMETADLDKKITVAESMVNSRDLDYTIKLDLKAGEKLSMKSLLYAVMLYGANDACKVVACTVGSSEEGFMKKVNEYITSLGCKNTKLLNSTGFDASGQYTTAEDILTIMSSVVKIPLFTEIFGAKSYTIPATSQSGERNISTGNKLTYSTVPIYFYSYVTGGRLGATDGAGYTSITTATKDGYTYLCVVLGSAIDKLDGIELNFSVYDAKRLYTWAFSNIKFKVVASVNQVVTVMDLIAGSESDHVTLVPSNEVSTLVPSLADADVVLIEPIPETIPKKLYAPIKKGDTVCRARILYAGEEIALVDLVASETISLSVPRLVLEKVKEIISSKIFIGILLLLVALIVIYIIFAVFDNRKSKRNRIHVVGK